MKRLLLLAALAIAGVGAGVAVGQTAGTGTVSACATAALKAKTIAVDSTPVVTIKGASVKRCATVTYTIPTVTATTTVPTTVTTAPTYTPPSPVQVASELFTSISVAAKCTVSQTVGGQGVYVCEVDQIDSATQAETCSVVQVLWVNGQYVIQKGGYAPGACADLTPATTTG